MRILELFCGTKGITNAFKSLGFECVSVDMEARFAPTICANVLDLNASELGQFDVVWASPPCNAFSVAVIGRNWYHDHTPKNDTARKGLEILTKTVELIQAINPRLWWIENPRGKMRRMPIMQDFRRCTVAYCQYGDTRQKPTFGQILIGHRDLCANVVVIAT